MEIEIMITTPFIAELMNQRPNFSEPLLHRNFQFALEELKEFGRFDTGGSIIAITGPSQSGKSLLVGLLVEFLLAEIFRDAPEDSRPLIGASAQVSRDGRTTPKFIYEMLLADCGSPLFDLAKLGQANYRASVLRTETRLLTALTQAMRYLNTRFVVIDETQYLVRAKDPQFKSALLESLKSLVSGSRTLILAGGYEFLDVLLGSRAHLAARTTVVHLGAYKGEELDKSCWLSILKTLASNQRLDFSAGDTLFKCADELLAECHGVIGILEHRLQKAKMRAAALGRAIDVSIIRACRPTKEQWGVVQADIALGEFLLQKVERLDSPALLRQDARRDRAGTTKLPAKPFTKKPNRAVEGYGNG